MLGAGRLPGVQEVRLWTIASDQVVYVRSRDEGAAARGRVRDGTSPRWDTSSLIAADVQQEFLGGAALAPAACQVVPNVASLVAPAVDRMATVPLDRTRAPDRSKVVAMGERPRLARVLPDAYKQLVGLNEILTRTASEEGLDTRLLNLVEIRASQINGCAACVDMHAHSAVKHGETSRRLALLPVWRETDLFSEQERAALALTEAMTELPGRREVPDEIYDSAAAVFTERQLAVVVWMAAEIQAFNRLNVTARTRLPESDW